MVSVSLLGIIVIILILSFSYLIYFVTQNSAERDIKNALITQQTERQLETNKAISVHIASDLNYIQSRLNLIADSRVIQEGQFSSNGTHSLLKKQFDLITLLTGRPDSIFVVNSEGIVKSQITNAQNGKLNTSLSYKNMVKNAQTGMPSVSTIYNKNDSPRILLSYPAIKEGSNEFLGLIGFSLPTTVFEKYGNLYGVKSQYLAVLDKNATHVIHGNKALVGRNFFESYTQKFTQHNPNLNDLINKVLHGQSGHAIYTIASGERITTGYPINLSGKSLLFLFIITPTAPLYSQVDHILQSLKIETMLLLIIITTSCAIFIVFLLLWANRLDKAVLKRTSELKTTNETLSRANEKLKLQGNSQKDFINIAAHELRTPSQAILGYSEMLKMFPEKVNYIDLIYNGANQLQDLIDELLDVTRIESNILSIQKAPFYLDDMIDNIVQRYKTKGGEGNQKTKITYERLDSDKITVTADHSKIERVITNLINNALKFTPYGEIFITTKEEKENKRVIVSIRDTGEGVDPEIIPNLFQKFTTKSQRGLGLGLYISKNIIESHGGKIWYERNKSGGSIFKFILPL
jgi:signal transduction histidine kinase